MKPLGFFIAVLLLATFASFADDSSTDPTKTDWRGQMKLLSQSVADGFPFFYSKKEFENPENKAILEKHFSNLTRLGHSIPEAEGQRLLGMEPLLTASLSGGLQQQLDRAKELYTLGEIVESQQTLQSAVKTCFACHAAYQIGKNSSETNMEVLAMPTAFPKEKVIVLGALRQFSGALQLLEKSLEKGNQLGARVEKSDDLKLFLLIALRSDGDFAKGNTVLRRLLATDKALPINSHNALVKWQEDLDYWNGISVEPTLKIPRNRKGGTSYDFVFELMRTSKLHTDLRAMKPDKVDPKSLALIYAQLGRSYQTMAIESLAILPHVYWQACKETASKSQLDVATLCGQEPQESKRKI